MFNNGTSASQTCGGTYTYPLKTIAKEIEEKVKGGMNQTDAGMQVMRKYEEELKKLV